MAAFGGCILQNVRDNSQGQITKIIIGAVIVLLLLAGSNVIIRAIDYSDVAAKVNGGDVSLNEV